MLLNAGLQTRKRTRVMMRDRSTKLLRLLCAYAYASRRRRPAQKTMRS